MPTSAASVLALTAWGPTIFATIRDLNFSEYTISIVTSTPPARGAPSRPI